MSVARLAHIVRHPVKSLGFQEIERAALTKGRPLPFDRRWALATQAAGFDSDTVAWAMKNRFVRGAAAGTLQAVRAEFDDNTGRLTLTHPSKLPFNGVLPDDGPALREWVRPLWPDTRPEPDRLVACTNDDAFGDVPEPYLSILSLTSNRILGKRMGFDLSIHRWRGNLWLEGLAPWEEFDLLGREIQIGEARLKVEHRIARCVATTYDPATGREGGDTLTALEQGWEHTDFGVYARVIQSGTIALNDTMTVLP